ncbi:MAG: type II toxin-antitoxin system RelE/ParE family toxin [Candidatus Bathyarchaeota archaeon]|nr:type II toxin-antitoxin system RelE/ParE family toxin [Candidatus Bathyarchaeota archaeon]MDH5624287.1 type II toxin-antitoxin system RelE/ParE family toxin [Candidatus Bathyarchaeota archaeon]MDH5635725.1 type II toxin-antitoxin system RelE/ParE family toxin [Candidatus Bathyarchaeota archaeon]MDH5702531.1 type II toxin-antitoxin system RelE/ParE family toxin [Candidatus Bathyarchaeota archaeon]
MEEIELLESNPEFGEKLKGVLSDIHKLRVHDYRVAYKIHTSNETIEVFFVDHRKRAYQELERLRREEII